VPDQSSDAAYWQNAAIHARTMAETFNDTAARLSLLEIAIRYEAIARRVHAQQPGLTLVDCEAKRKAG
jgi:hypothetical protein